MTKQPIHLENRDEQGLRLFSPTAGRNSEPISKILSHILPVSASVLEIGSGTGEHAVSVCKARSDIRWQTSDPDERSRQSQDDWRTECPDQIAQSMAIDVTRDNWWIDLPKFDAMFSANMIHIAPWSAAQGFVAGAAQILSETGLAVLYGPFFEGETTAESNLRFDANLKARNPEWGVRSLDSVKHIFADVGFNLLARYEMPAENRILVFSRE